MEEIIYLFAISTSIGSFVFLIQQTDFIYEYVSLFSRLVKLKYIDFVLKFEHYEKNSSSFENYIQFIGSVFGVKKNLAGFICRLLSCFICLSCFLSLVSTTILYKNIYYFFPCFFISVVIYFILFSIKRKIYS